MNKEHKCTTDCEWLVLDTEKDSLGCFKYDLPIKLGDICKDEYPVFIPIHDMNIVKARVADDQKVKADYGKAKLSLVPRRIIWDIAAIREYGNNKYPEGGPDNWKKVDVQRYRDALYRHLLYYLDDPNGVDKESGFPHLWHLACNVAFLCELEDTAKGKE